MNITHAEPRDGMILATSDDGRQVTVFIDDRGEAHSGRSCSILVDGIKIDYVMPLGPDGVLRMPVNMRARRYEAR